MKNKVENIVNSIFPLSAKSFGEIERQLEYETHPKGEVFVQRNKRNKKVYFVLSGICKCYLIKPRR